MKMFLKNEDLLNDDFFKTVVNTRLTGILPYLKLALIQGPHEINPVICISIRPGLSCTYETIHHLFCKQNLFN